MENDCFTLLNKILKSKSINAIADILNVANGTVARWILNSNVPKQYFFELKKIEQ